MRVSRTLLFAGVLALGSALVAVPDAGAQSAKHYTFGYDQPKTTAYGFAGDTFEAKLKELSKGTMIIDQFPGAQLGQEPQMLQKVQTGDIDFIITSTANAATAVPEAGVFSIHFVFKGEVLDRPSRLIELGVIISICGQFGDLLISSIKRDLDIKDMGILFPGHGGWLDRFDSLILVAPAVFHFVGYFRGIGLDEPARILTGGY